MAAKTSLILHLFLDAALALALPSSLSPTNALTRRSSRSQKVGIPIAIAICVSIIMVIVFYLGMRRGQTGTWYCWRDAEEPLSRDTDSTAVLPITEKRVSTSKAKIKSERISRPMIQHIVPIRTSTVISPLSEAMPRLELPGEDKIFEIGPATPRFPAPNSTPPQIPTLPPTTRLTWRSDRRSWHWFERRSRVARSRASEREKSLYELDGSSASPPPAYASPPLPPMPDRAFLSNERGQRSDRKESEGGGAMDWTGIEYLRKMYTMRGSVHRSDN